MSFVLDASVALVWCFEDEVSEYADAVLGSLRLEEALVPSIWPLEVANGLAGGERRARLTVADVVEGSALLLNLPISVAEVSTDLALGRILDLARAQSLTAYDAAFLELAMREGLPIATEDQDLVKAARVVGLPLFEPR